MIHPQKFTTQKEPKLSITVCSSLIYKWAKRGRFCLLSTLSSHSVICMPLSTKESFDHRLNCNNTAISIQCAVCLLVSEKLDTWRRYVNISIIIVIYCFSFLYHNFCFLFDFLIWFLFLLFFILSIILYTQNNKSLTPSVHLDAVAHHWCNHHLTFGP